MARFHELAVAEIDRQTPESVALGFDVPEALREAFSFLPGQYLTLSTEIDGQEVRAAPIRSVRRRARRGCASA